MSASCKTKVGNTLARSSDCPALFAHPLCLFRIEGIIRVSISSPGLRAKMFKTAWEVLSTTIFLAVLAAGGLVSSGVAEVCERV